MSRWPKKNVLIQLNNDGHLYKIPVKIQQQLTGRGSSGSSYNIDILCSYHGYVDVNTACILNDDGHLFWIPRVAFKSAKT